MVKRKLVVISDDEEGDEEEGQQPHSQRPAKPWAKLPFSTSSQGSPKLALPPTGDCPKEVAAWVVKYAPRKLSDLLVHSKKVSEVRAWLENRLTAAFPGVPSILLLVGPSGVGKSSVVQVLANVIGFELCEWTTPVPTLWQEHLHNAVTRPRYVSKLEEFEAFLSTASKYPSLALSGTGGSSPAGAGKVLLIDDFPMVSAGEEKERLLRALRAQLLASQFPCVVVLSNVRGDMNRVMLEIQQTLEWSGATCISFNPLTASAVQKLLLRVSSSERCKVSVEMLSAVAENCDGDVRSAISSLQFLCVGSQDSGTFGPSTNVKMITNGKKVRKLKGGGRKPICRDQRSTLQKLSSITIGRDCSLVLFHALGKLLYNKRLAEQTGVDDPRDLYSGLLHQYSRLPLNMEEPETILARASMDSGTVLAFLQENVVDFIHDEAIDDVADVMGYFSDSDFLLGSNGSWRTSRSFSPSLGDEHTEARDICVAAAGSVAARGVLFGNVHSAPRKWQALRSPSLWQVEKDMATTKADIWAQRLASNGAPSMAIPTVITTEIGPFFQRLSLLSPSYCQIFERAASLVNSKATWENVGSPGHDEVETQFCDLKLIGSQSQCYRGLPPSTVSGGEDDDDIEDW